MTSINTNIGALIAQKNMANNSAKLESSMERISSGLRINSASDDAAGSAIASKMESQVRSLGVAVRNANDAISLTQTAEGALSEVENILQRIRELTVQAGNSTLNTSDRSQIQAEVNALSSEIDSISNRTNFNGVNLLDGSRAAVSMQIGINASDTMSIGLQKTDVAALGIGSSSVSSSNTITSARMTELGSVNITTTDIKINGKNFAASDFDMDATTVDGASANVSAAVAAGSRQAAALAVKINENTGEHGVTATAFNEVVATMYASGSIEINGTTIAARATVQEFVSAVNDEIANVSASINSDGFVVFSNTDGDAIGFVNSAPELGIADDVYAGFVRLSSNTNSPITIEAGTKLNGYAANTGTLLDVTNVGFNETRVNTAGLGTKITGSRAVDATAIASSTDGLKINGVQIGTSTSASATDKVTAINALTSQHGVVATAETSVKVNFNFASLTGSEHAGAKVNGITVNLSAAIDMSDVVTAVNTATNGVVDIIATADATTGDLVLTSASGLTISMADTAATDGAGFGNMIKAVTNLDGSDVTGTLATGTFTNRGTISMTSLSGASISIEDGPADRDGETGADRIGFEKQNEIATSTSGVSVASVSSANTSLASIDSAINSVASFRAGFGAHQNRLDASINNLTTLQVNTDAARSRIEDADFASETSNMTKAQILSQAATSMLAQANASKQNLLALLQG
jgi:flagellin